MSPAPAVFTKNARFLSEASRNRLAWLIVFLHATSFLLAIANMSPPSPGLANFIEQSRGSSTTAILAGRPFHYHYESFSLQILFLVDLPSELASVPVAFLLLPVFKPFHLGRFTGSYIGAGIVLVVSSMQWLTIGYRADKWLGSKVWGSALLRRIDRSFTMVTILIFLLTASSVPFINTGSRRLGLHHAATSFR
jgi:hypothetical protein